MKIIKINNGYKQIVYTADEFGNIAEPILSCVMCNGVGFFIAEETKEAPCENCRRNNDEARVKR